MRDKFLVIKLRHEDQYNINLKKIKNYILEQVSLEFSNCDVKIVSEKQSVIHRYGFENMSIFSSRIQKLLNFIHRNFAHKITLEKASSVVCLSKYYFGRIFLSEIGISFNKYLNIFRLFKAAEVLRSNNDISVTNVCFDVGFNDFSNFIRQFKRTFGCSPKKFQNCCIDPKICSSRKKSLLFEISNYNDRLNKSLDFPIKYSCSIMKQKK